MIRRAAFRYARVAAILLATGPGQGALAQDREFQLAAPADLLATGLMSYLSPRFSLKHGVTMGIVAEGSGGGADLRVIDGAGASGPLVFGRGDGGQVYAIALETDNPHAARFSDWLLSDIGQRAVEAYVGDDGETFAGLAGEEPPPAAIETTGDADKGLVLSRDNCGRCHVIHAANRMRGIGSTPSFFALRALPDWYDRFSSFFSRNPHPAFTQISDVSVPFDPELPPPIAPVELSLGDLEDILTYVTGLEPADLGEPVRSQ